MDVSVFGGEEAERSTTFDSIANPTAALSKARKAQAHDRGKQPIAANFLFWVTNLLGKPAPDRRWAPPAFTPAMAAIRKAAGQWDSFANDIKSRKAAD